MSESGRIPVVVDALSPEQMKQLLILQNRELDLLDQSNRQLAARLGELPRLSAPVEQLVRSWIAASDALFAAVDREKQAILFGRGERH